MKCGIWKIAGFFMLALCVASIGVVAYAEDDAAGVPAGWSKGEKKGWQGEAQPPGLMKKEAGKAKGKVKEATDEAEKIAKEAKEKVKKN